MLQVQYQKKFLKDLENISMPYRREIEHFVFDILPSLNMLAESGNEKKRYKKGNGRTAPYSKPAHRQVASTSHTQST